MMKPMFEQGWDAAHNAADKALRDAKGNANKAADALHVEAQRALGALVEASQYAAGKLTYFRDGQLDIAPELTRLAVQKLRDAANLLEGR